MQCTTNRRAAGGRRAREVIADAEDARDLDLVRYLEALLRDPCAYCGGPAGTIDHVHAADNGGSNHWSNLTAACRPCNTSKHTVSLVGWLGWRASPDRAAALAVLDYERRWRAV